MKVKVGARGVGWKGYKGLPACVDLQAAVEQVVAALIGQGPRSDHQRRIRPIPEVF